MIVRSTRLGVKYPSPIVNLLLHRPGHPVKRLLQFFLLPWVLLCAGCGKSDEEHRRNADAFAQVIPILEEERVAILMYEDWCKVLKNDRGMFFESDNGKYPFTGEATPFDSTASNDFDRIWERISATQADFHLVKGIKRDRSGKVIRAVFSWGGRSPGRDQHLYHYAPGYSLPEDQKDGGIYKLRHTRIDDDWYYLLKQLD